MNGSRAIVTGLPADRRPRLKAVVREIAPLHDPKWIFAFVLIELACQISLLFPTFEAVRVFVRSAAFISSAIFLVVLRRGPESHPSSQFALIAIAIMTLSFAHPTTNSMLGALATTVFAVAVIGPVFWVPRIRIDITTLRWLCLIYWFFNSLSAFFGALQIYYPGRFEPALSSAMTENAIESLHIMLADGTRVRRPMGLTDGPGGAGIGAAFSIVFALGFLMDRPRPLFRLLLLASIGISSFTLYLCQLRSMLVMTIISLVAMGFPLAVRGRLGRYLKLTVPVLAIALVAFTVAVSIGGNSVTGRLSTLVDDDVGTVYYTNRGTFLSRTFTDFLPQFPLGAGLARWGMMAAYFGDPYNPNSTGLWAEIQWTGWLYDGGVPLMLAYGAALVTAFLVPMRLALRVGDARLDDLSKWATMIFGYTVSMIALTFNSCPFETTMGVDCWLLNAAVFAAGEQLLSPKAPA